MISSSKINHAKKTETYTFDDYAEECWQNKYPGSNPVIFWWYQSLGFLEGELHF